MTLTTRPGDAPPRLHSAVAPRLAVFLQDLSGGGAERMLLRLAEAFAERGHPVDLVLVRAEGQYLDQVPHSVNIVDLGAARTRSAVWRLSRYLDRARPAAMLSGLVHVNVAALLARAIARHRMRLVISERNTISADRHAATTASVKLAHRAVPFAYRRADAIVAVSDGVAQDLARFAGLARERIAVINNPVVTPALHRQAAQRPTHPWFGPGQPPLILAVGRLAPQKDFLTLLQAFARLRSRRPARLAILGDGEERDLLVAESERLGIGADVALPGFISNPFAWMAGASVLALSSRWEGSPNVLVEAMACGTPVVATDCPSGPAQILRDGALGRLVSVGDAAALAGALERTLERPVAADELRRRAADYSVGQSSAAYLDLLLGRESRPAAGGSNGSRGGS